MNATRPPLLEFPCHFPLKVIGQNVEEFEIQVMKVVQRHVTEADTSRCTRRLSAGNKYLALTISFMAQSQEQLDALYTELHRLELVKVTL
jgi:putative lipoic acid-binding regulatory protein